MAVGAGLGRAQAQSAPSFDVAAADAAHAGKALVLEVGAAWCGPCRLFERDILPVRAVQAALGRVSFVRYDADVSPGVEVTDRFHVSAFPTFLIVDPADGRELERITGIPETSSTWFVQFLDRARTGSPIGASLQAAVAAHPDAPEALLALADYERSQAHTISAIRYYRDAQHSPQADRETIARATDAIERLDRAARLRAGLDDDLRFVTRRPESPSASKALMRLAIARFVSRAHIRELAELHLARLRPSRWNEVVEAVHVGMLASAAPAAFETARSWFAVDPDHPAMKLLMGEVALYRGDFELATGDMIRICGDRAPGGYELRCYALGLAISTQRRMPPGVIHAVESTRAALEGHPPDMWLDLESLAELGSFGPALATTMLDAARSCRPATTRTAYVSVDLDVEAGSERVRVLAVRGAHEAPLEACLRERIGANTLAARPLWVRTFSLPLVVEPGSAVELDTSDPKVPRPVASGVLTFASATSGASGARGIGAIAVSDLGAFADMRALVGGQVEAGVNEDADASVAARGLFGLGHASKSRLVLVLLTGAGVSRHRAGSPLAVDVPIELAGNLAVASLRVSVWVRATVVLRDSMRATGRFGGDETAFGVGASHPIAGVRVFIGGQLERSALGMSAAIRVGLPFGGRY